MHPNTMHHKEGIMKPIVVVATAWLLFAGPAEARKEQGAEQVVASGALAGPAAPMKCIRGKEIGSNRIKRVCLPEDQLKRLSRDEIADLMRGDKGAAELLAP